MANQGITHKNWLAAFICAWVIKYIIFLVIEQCDFFVNVLFMNLEMRATTYIFIIYKKRS